MTRGNLAVRPVPRKKVVKRTRVVRTGLSIGEKLFYLACLSLCIGVAAYLITQYTVLASVNYQVQDLRKQIQQEKEQVLQLQMELAKNSTPEKIIGKAEQMGMSVDEKRLIILSKE
ncbi:MAG: hypothetical protein BAA01_13240 [Bacillus thermozeamaize]|uniref:Cell division protein FtsL n=1 Tax=Bacillus thermozeamaize TaxID=230954 RepID=A0A1Y3PK54_9BACI|nr:MAG: hypothetical protein BAA01_13240 [Bacillus thermozeamaize]